MFTSTRVRDKHIQGTCVHGESSFFSCPFLHLPVEWHGRDKGSGTAGLCVSRGDRELPELVTAQESPWWPNTLSKTEGSGRADRGALDQPKSNAGCPGPLIAPDHPHSLWSGTRNYDTIQISFLSGPCCRFCHEQSFNLVLRAVDSNLSACCSLQWETEQLETDVCVFSSSESCDLCVFSSGVSLQQCT